MSNTYCSAIKSLGPVHQIYHDQEYGFPVDSDNALFGRLLLEINQAGLSWTTILKKKENFKKAYSQFDIQKVAKYDDQDILRLLSDPGIVRNKLKINASIFNAQKIMELQEQFGSFSAWLDDHHPMKKDDWVKLFKMTFKFTGGEITKEFLMSTGYIKGAHSEDCPIFHKIQALNPPWLKSEK